jgi:hypothetical protein
MTGTFPELLFEFFACPADATQNVMFDCFSRIEFEIEGTID